jgi:hypothetical protein
MDTPMQVPVRPAGKHYDYKQSETMEDGSALTPELLMTMGLGVAKFFMAERRWMLLGVVGSLVATVLGVRAIVRGRRRPQRWTERLAGKVGIDFDAGPTEATIRSLGKEVERLRHELEQRIEKTGKR